MIRLTIVGLLTFLLGGISCGAKKARIGSRSMEPTIRPHEIFQVDYKAYRSLRPELWDVVIFDSPVQSESFWCSRVVAFPGDVVDFKSGTLFVNGQVRNAPERLNLAPYAMPTKMEGYSKPIQFPYAVPVDHYFLLGDNTKNSYDSRYLGGIAGISIRGKVLNK